MNQRLKKLLVSSLLLCSAFSVFGTAPAAQAAPDTKEVTTARGQGLLGDMPVLETIATSPYQWTGITVTPTGRIFVCYPAGPHRPDYFSVAEIVGGTPQPVIADTTFGSAESLVADAAGNLWVLDASAALGRTHDPALARIAVLEPDTGAVLQTYALGDALEADSHPEDLRLDEKNRLVYLTDSGHGGILLLDLATGEVRRALTDIPEVRANLQSIYFPHAGLFTDMKHSCGLELSKDGGTLYFAARGGDILYSVPTAVLRDPALPMADRAKKIRVENMHNPPSDGMTRRRDMLFMGDLADEGVYSFIPDTENPNEAGAILELGMDFRWADGFATAPDSTVYFTTSAKNYGAEQQPPYTLYRLIFPKAAAEK